jgi:hypothetical protein
MTPYHRMNSIKTLLLTACVTTALTTLVVSPRTASAVTIDWSIGANGDFGDTANWIGGVIPGANDLVSFNKTGAYTVTFDISSTNEDLFVNRGVVNFVSDGSSRTLFLGSASGGQSAEIFSRLTLDGSAGSFKLQTVNQLTVSTGVLTVIDGARADPGQLEVFNSGRVEIMGSTALVKSTGTTTINTDGEVLVDAGELQYFAPMLIDFSTLTIQNSGSVTSQSTPGATLTIQNGGLLDPDQANKERKFYLFLESSLMRTEIVWRRVSPLCSFENN